MLLLLTTLFLLLYGALIFYYFYHWLQLKEPSSFMPANVFISVVVAARNEEDKIGRLLNALGRQTYPGSLFEVIIVDDFSTDRTAEMVRPFLDARVRLIQPGVEASKSSKKKAIEAGINEAKGQVIVITDADCLVPAQWLQTIAGFVYETSAVFVAAPVKLISTGSLAGIFQSLDFITLQGITAASVRAGFHSMCNGANLAYTRQAFYQAGGFAGIDKVASGDDMLLMYKIWKNHPGRVFYLKSKNVIVETEAMPTWKQFIRQRIRWSSKAVYYDDHRVLLVLLFVYIFNFLFFVLLAAACIQHSYGWLLILYLAGKTVIEWPFVFSVARFYDEQKLIKYFPFFQPLHIFYVVSIGLISQIGKYEWKGRTVK